MVQIESSCIIKTLSEFEKKIEESHFYFRKWTDKVTYGDEVEYEDFMMLSEIGKNTHGIWVFEYENNPESNEKYMGIYEAYSVYLSWIKRCKPNNAYDVAEVDNTEDWVEDNEWEGEEDE